METLVIQSDINNILEVDRFVYSICDTFNIYNYSAVISMSLLQAVKNAIGQDGNSNSSKEIKIAFDQCRGGVYFTISVDGGEFDFCSQLSSDSLFLMRSLTDQLTFSDNGSAVRLFFVINGIEASRALERITTLRRYYIPRTVEV